jgi:hypothetical protein
MFVTRREFLGATAGAIALNHCNAILAADVYQTVATVERERVLQQADKYLDTQPVTITSSRSQRSQGGLHDYFSEGDYWWPDPANPDGPYVRRDGFTNPQNFSGHREALIRFGVLAPALVSAYRLSAKKQYADAFARHLHAWFFDPATRMNPNLEFAQAIHGVTPGRGTGIIDTLQWIDLVRGIRVMAATGGLSAADIAPVREWFAAYVDWMYTSENGHEEMIAKNNHGTCWVLQVAEFAQFAKRPDLVALCRDRFKTALVPDQIARNGSTPLELARTKPYSYSLFDSDVLCGICASLTTPKDNLWTFKGPNGAGVADNVAFLYTFLADKSKWPFARDVEYFEDFPSRRSSLLLAGTALHHPEYIATWRRLDGRPTVPEVIRNLPIRQPLLWIDPVLRA